MKIQFLVTRTIGQSQYAPGETLSVDDEIGDALISVGDARLAIEAETSVAEVAPPAIETETPAPPAIEEEHHG